MLKQLKRLEEIETKQKERERLAMQQGQQNGQGGGGGSQYAAVGNSAPILGGHTAASSRDASARAALGWKQEATQPLRNEQQHW